MKLNLVPARTGIQWFKLGLQTFWRQPLALSGLFLIYMAVAALLSVLPVIGLVLTLAITPAATLGLMVATQEATKGRFPMPTVLVAAFRAGRQRLRGMVQLGLIYAVGSLLVMALAVGLAGLAGAGAAPAAPAPSGTPAMPDTAMLFRLALHMPLAAMFWFAPALVHWHGVTPVKSLFFSFVAILRNFSAFLVYALAWAGLWMAVAVVASAVMLMLDKPERAFAMMMPVALILAAMFFTSVYFTFLDNFTADPAEPAEVLVPPTTGPTP